MDMQKIEDTPKVEVKATVVRSRGEQLEAKKRAITYREHQSVKDAPVYTRPPIRTSKGRRTPPNFGRARHARGGGSAPQQDDASVRRLIRNICICAGIILLVLIARYVQTPLTDNVVSGLRTALTFDVDVEETLGQLKFVQEKLPDVAEVFMQRPKGEDVHLAMPAEGQVVSRYIAMRNECIDIATKDGEHVKAAADGTVSEVGNDSEGQYVVVQHANKLVSIYRGMGEVSVKAQDAVKQGSVMGTAGKVNGTSLVRFALYQDEKAIDPLPLMGGVQGE
nr:M23 family metallopeptidase [Maliibacterium massiliense]